MKTFHALLAAASLMGSASLALAQQQQQDPTPIPALKCEFKSFSACTPDGACKTGGDVAGLTVPLKVTVDFENGVVSAVDQNGSPRTDKFDSAAGSGGQLILHGIDGAFGWQLLIHDESQGASLSFATADSTLSGFGTCATK